VTVFDNTSKTEDVMGEILTIPLIDNNRLIIWENPPKETKMPSLQNSNLTLVLWFDYEIDPKNYSDAEIFFFTEEKEASIFPFLDYLGSKNAKAYLELAKRNVTSPNDTQYILTMVAYLLRNLVVTPKEAKDFVMRKNESMRKNFSKQELINLYKFILEIDFKIKRGLMEANLAEFFLVNKFLST